MKMSKEEVKFAMRSGWRAALSHHGDPGESVKYARNSKMEKVPERGQPSFMKRHIKEDEERKLEMTFWLVHK